MKVITFVMIIFSPLLYSCEKNLHWKEKYEEEKKIGLVEKTEDGDGYCVYHGHVFDKETNYRIRRTSSKFATFLALGQWEDEKYRERQCYD